MPLFAYMPFFIIAAILVRAAVGLGWASMMAFKAKVLYRNKGKEQKEGSDVDPAAAVWDFEAANFFVTLLTCLFVDGAVGLIVGCGLKALKVKFIDAPKEEDAAADSSELKDNVNSHNNSAKKAVKGAEQKKLNRKTSSTDVVKKADGPATVPALKGDNTMDNSWPSSDSFLDISETGEAKSAAVAGAGGK
jgi:hypothetical protein